MRCTRSAAYPNAVATPSSVTVGSCGMNSGGAGSVPCKGIGKGTPRMVYSRSGGESNSIGKMNPRVDNSDVWIGLT